MRVVIAITSIVTLAGCAGLEVKTLKAEQVAAARTTGAPLDGYVVYEPLVAVEISIKEVCLGGKDEKGNCKGELVTQCAASVPFMLPDYSRPYLVASKSGFGKAGVEVAITDGWRLGGIKDASDNTAILSALGLKTASAGVSGAGCKAPGLYRAMFDGSGVRLEPLGVF